MTEEKDIVLIYVEDKQLSYARIESILPDIKKDWFVIELLLLQIPLQTITWTLKEEYINGEEFEIGGNRMRIENVESKPEPVIVQETNNKSNVISFPKRIKP